MVVAIVFGPAGPAGARKGELQPPGVHFTTLARATRDGAADHAVLGYIKYKFSLYSFRSGFIYKMLEMHRHCLLTPSSGESMYRLPRYIQAIMRKIKTIKTIQLWIALSKIIE
jgi:hypothetical protein